MQGNLKRINESLPRRKATTTMKESKPKNKCIITSCLVYFGKELGQVYIMHLLNASLSYSLLEFH